MQSKWWIGVTICLALLVPGLRADDEHGHGHGKKHGRDHDEHGDRHYYREHDREIHEWYRGQGDHLPPGLAKRDRLPPGLERQLRVRGTLPPGLRKKMYPCPRDLEYRLPPPPPGYGHFLIGGNVVLINRSTYMVLDIFHMQ